MIGDEGPLGQKLKDPQEPRTPLFFKQIQYFPGNSEHDIPLGLAPSIFYRSEGFACGFSMPAPKPLSRFFKNKNEP
jgi:hypothetical protein